MNRLEEKANLLNEQVAKSANRLQWKSGVAKRTCSFIKQVRVQMGRNLLWMTLLDNNLSFHSQMYIFSSLKFSLLTLLYFERSMFYGNLKWKCIYFFKVFITLDVWHLQMSTQKRRRSSQGISPWLFLLHECCHGYSIVWSLLW